MTIAAERELGPRDVDSIDRPVFRQEREVFARADADFQPDAQPAAQASEDAVESACVRGERPLEGSESPAPRAGT